MALQAITLTLSDKDGRVNVDMLIKTLENWLELLKSIEGQMLAADIPVEWELVRVQMQSPLEVTIAPRVKGRVRTAVGTQLVKACFDGVKKLEKGPISAKFFDSDALDATRKMLSLPFKTGASLKIARTGQPPIELTPKTVQHIEQITERDRLYMDYSTIEGKLDMISAHGGGKSLFVWELMTNHKIECELSDEQFQEYITLDMLEKRVSVTGRVSYRNHIPRRIVVERPIRVLRDMNQLPQPQTMKPIDITGGLSSEEYVRRLRDA